MFEINSKLIIVKFLKLIKYRVNLDSVNFMISYFVIVADSMLFSPALVLDRPIAPLLAVSSPTLSDAHWAWASDFGL